MAGFALSPHSVTNLSGVNVALVAVIQQAALGAEQAFGVSEGLRSADQQLIDWLKGRSKLNGIPIGETQNGHKGTGVGKHQLGLAVDVYPIVNGQADFNNWKYFYPVIDSIRVAAIALGTIVRWGGVWDRHLNDLQAGPTGLEKERDSYIVRHPGKDFLDGPHIELVNA